MAKTTLAVKLDRQIAEKVKKFCSSHGVKQGFFVEKALEQKLEEEDLKEDLLDFKLHRCEEKSAISFEEYLRKRAR